MTTIGHLAFWPVGLKTIGGIGVQHQFFVQKFKTKNLKKKTSIFTIAIIHQKSPSKKIFFSGHYPREHKILQDPDKTIAVGQTFKTKIHQNSTINNSPPKKLIFLLWPLSQRTCVFIYLFN